MLTEQDVDRSGAPVPPKDPLRGKRPQLKLAASLVAVTAMLAAAGATIAVPAAAGPALAGTLAGRVSAPRTPAAIAADSRSGATAYARHLLARLRLPGGSRRMHWKHVADLSPSLALILTDVVDPRALYHVPEPMTELGKYLQAHAPGGMTVSSTGWFSNRGKIRARTVTFSPRRLPAGIYSAMLVTTFKPTRNGAALLRADAQVAWFPSRGGAVRLRAADYASVTITRSRQDGRDKRSRTVSGARQVRKLVALYNRLHGAPDAVTTCPEDGPSTIEYRLAFHPARTAQKVVLAPTNCLTVGVTIGSHPEPDLYPASAVVAAARRVLR
ncbi:MAG TPA: hypothetical protein VMA32_14570 [Streptosporangiaceae bacterium]|nr:hypothetical protein [Streptosporangiaceae bacterium]